MRRYLFILLLSLIIVSCTSDHSYKATSEALGLTLVLPKFFQLQETYTGADDSVYLRIIDSTAAWKEDSAIQLNIAFFDDSLQPGFKYLHSLDAMHYQEVRGFIKKDRFHNQYLASGYRAVRQDRPVEFDTLLIRSDAFRRRYLSHLDMEGDLHYEEIKKDGIRFIKITKTLTTGTRDIYYAGMVKGFWFTMAFLPVNPTEQELFQKIWERSYFK